MTDDIVTELRALAYHNGDNFLREAADEIERLRKAGDALAEGIRTGHWDDALDAWTEGSND